MTETVGSLLDLTVRELLDAVAARTPSPGGGAVAALVTALAAALAGMAARFGDPDSTAAAQADALRARAAPLADADATAYAAFLTALRLPRDNPARSGSVARTRDGASAVPTEVAEIASAVSELGGTLARDGNPNLRGDATAAALLAAAAAVSAAELVAANTTGSDPRTDRARRVVETARQRAIGLSDGVPQP